VIEASSNEHTQTMNLWSPIGLKSARVLLRFRRTGFATWWCVLASRSMAFAVAPRVLKRAATVP